MNTVRNLKLEDAQMMGANKKDVMNLCNDSKSAQESNVKSFNKQLMQEYFNNLWSLSGDEILMEWQKLWDELWEMGELKDYTRLKEVRQKMELCNKVYYLITISEMIKKKQSETIKLKQSASGGKLQSDEVI